MNRLSGLCYHELREYDILSSYKMCTIPQAGRILFNRGQPIKRGRKIKDSIVKNPFNTNCYGAKTNCCLLIIPYKIRNPINIRRKYSQNSP